MSSHLESGHILDMGFHFSLGHIQGIRIPSSGFLFRILIPRIGLRGKVKSDVQNVSDPITMDIPDIGISQVVSKCLRIFYYVSGHPELF